MPCIQLQQLKETDERPVQQASVYNPSVSVMEIWKGAPESTLAHIEALSQILGVQEYRQYVFQMRTKLQKRLEADPFFVEGSEEDVMCLSIEKMEVSSLNVGTLEEWYSTAIQQLLAEADNEKLAPEEYYNKKELLFELQRRASSIAKGIRGSGNVILASTSGIKLFPHEFFSSPAFRRFKIVEVPDGVYSDKPFAVVGYVGSSKYDSSLILSLVNTPNANGKYFGSFVSHDIEKYWKRLI